MCFISADLTISSSTFSDISVALSDFSAEADFFRGSGFSMVKKVYTSDDINVYRDTIRNAMKSGPRKAKYVRPRVMFEKNSTKDFRLLDALSHRYPEIVHLVKSEVLRSIAARFLGTSTDNICILVDKSFFKDPGDHATHWHVDSDANNMGPKMNGLTAWIPFQNMSKKNGLLRYVLGSQMQAHGLGSYNVTRHLRPDEQVAGFNAMSVGDVAFHHIQTRHGSYPNTLKVTREALGIIFIVKPQKSGDPLSNVFGKHQEQQRHFCLHYWTCPFGLYENVFPRMRKLCRSCDPVFSATDKSTTTTLGQASACVDEIMQVCDDFFRVDDLAGNLRKKPFERSLAAHDVCPILESENLEKWQQQHIMHLCNHFGYVSHDFNSNTSYRTSRRILWDSFRRKVEGENKALMNVRPTDKVEGSSTATRSPRKATRRGKRRNTKIRDTQDTQNGFRQRGLNSAGRGSRRPRRSSMSGDHIHSRKSKILRSDQAHKIKNEARTTSSIRSSVPPPFRILSKDVVGEVIVDETVLPTLHSQNGFCCATKYSAAWDNDGELLVAVVDNLFCESYYDRLYSMVHNPDQIKWESRTTADSRINEAFFGGRRRGANERGISIIPMMVGNSLDTRQHLQLMKDVRACLLYALPERAFENLSVSDLIGYEQLSNVPYHARGLPAYRDSAATGILAEHPFLVRHQRHLGADLLPSNWFAASAYTRPEDLQFMQSAPHVDSQESGKTVHMASVYTLTRNKRFEASGTVFMRQRDTGLHKLQSDADHRLHMLHNDKLQAQALDRGEARETGYVNTTHTRWGESIMVVPNYANRISLYHAWRPHGAWIPSVDQLVDNPRIGRMTLNLFWRMHTVAAEQKIGEYCGSITAKDLKATSLPQELAEACDACSKWRDCAWYPRAEVCAPASCVYGIDFLKEHIVTQIESLDHFTCNASVGVHSANGACLQ